MADQVQQDYKENRGKERHERRVQAGLEENTNKESVKEEVKLIEREPFNKYDLRKYGTSENAEKYLYHCHTCGKEIAKGTEFCNDKCSEYVKTYGYSCKWGQECMMCNFNKRTTE